jgi:uncharacterized membrane protein
MQDIAYTVIFGKPLIYYFGILTFSSIIITAIVGYLNYKGYRTVPLKWHIRLAILSLTFATIHALMGVFSYL